MEEERSVYGECMRNHAATLGTYATDGCGEFTPDPSTPSSLLCAACHCHRNFHRKLQALSPRPLRFSEADPASRRRTRTKFTPEQKDRMLRFAERVGWRMPQGSMGDEVARFCKEVGVSKQVLRVWMHNHKGAGPSPSSSTSKAATEPSASSFTQ